MTDHRVVNLTPELIAQFKRDRLIDESTHTENVKLDVIKYGEKKIGELTEEEIILHKEMMALDASFSKALMKESVSHARSMLDKIEESIETTGDVEVKPDLLMADVAEEFSKQSRKLGYIKQLFWWTVESRLNVFSHKLAIRKGYVVVSSGTRYEVSEN